MVTIDSSWDFRTADTKTYTHCYHNYPAMMIPQIAEKLIYEYGKNASRLFDPYRGGHHLLKLKRGQSSSTMKNEYIVIMRKQ